MHTQPVDDNGTERTQLSIENNGDTHIEDGSLEGYTIILDSDGLFSANAINNKFLQTTKNYKIQKKSFIITLLF